MENQPEAKPNIEPTQKECEENEDKKSLIVTPSEASAKPKKTAVVGIKLPGFLKKTKNKNSNEEQQPVEMPADGKLTNMKTRFRNFVTRKSTTAKKPEKVNIPINVEEVHEIKENIEAEEKDALHSIKIHNENDKIKLAATKAGLASIETLNESLKDQDCTDSAPKSLKNAQLEAKAAAAAALDISEEKNVSKSALFLQSLRSYTCSVDDVLIVLGMILFLLLVSVIGFLLTRESLTSSPLRAGRYIDAVTSCGMVEGIKEDGSFAFRGLPYALPPVGDRRWKPAASIDNIEDCWPQKLKSYNKSDVLCSQLQTNDLNGTRIVGVEDCLYLDIITPHVRYDNLLPVVVLIGADSFTGPSPGILRPSARYARSHDVVFVRPNFRLGPFGFLALETLSKAAYPRSSGNYALTDIIMALKWIKLNIKNFGGNPDMVTLLGHRAGATLVTALASSEAAKQLFARVWVSSPSAMFPGKPLSYSEQRYQPLMHELNCSDLECLLNATAEQVWAATPDSWLHSTDGLPTAAEPPSAQQHEWLVLDGQILKRHPADYWKEQSALGLTDNPKFVMGTTLHEMHSNKLRLLHANWSAEQVLDYMGSSRLGELNLTAEAVSRYNCTNYNELIALITDIRSTCPLLINARIQAGVMFYLVTQGSNEEQLALLGADVLSILGRYEPHTVEERRYVSSMQQLFYYYVAHGRIPMYDARRRVVKIGQDPLAVEDHENCNFWITKDIVPRYARH